MVKPNQNDVVVAVKNDLSFYFVVKTRSGKSACQQSCAKVISNV